MFNDYGMRDPLEHFNNNTGMSRRNAKVKNTNNKKLA